MTFLHECDSSLLSALILFEVIAAQKCAKNGNQHCYCCTEMTPVIQFAFPCRKKGTDREEMAHKIFFFLLALESDKHLKCVFLKIREFYHRNFVPTNSC